MQMKVNKELEKAVLLGNLTLIKSLIKDGCDVNGKDKYGRTILYDAIVKGFQICFTNGTKDSIIGDKFFFRLNKIL